MTAVPVDRGDVLQGINKSVKDARVPYSLLRSLQNLRVPDGRAESRPGFSQVNTRKIYGNQLTKQTATLVQHEQSVGAIARKADWFRSPLSYGLLRWHDDYQPKSTRSWTVEFLLTLGEIEPLIDSPYVWEHRSKNLYGSTAERLNLRPIEGVLVYDQSVIAKTFQLNKAGFAASVAVTLEPFVLSALAVSYDRTAIRVNCCLVDDSVSPPTYYPYECVLQHAISNYQPGKGLHIAITYASSTRVLTLYVDRQPSTSHTLAANRKFAGEADRINGMTSVTSIQRDIVLLNECTARASYASTCKVGSSVGLHGHQVLDHYYETATQNTSVVPWCHSPPRGTGLCELRIWHEARSPANISNNAYSRITGAETNLKGYWRLDGGGGVCVDSLVVAAPASANSRRYVTIHHGSPGFIEDEGLVKNTGLVLADGQHVALSFGRYDYNFIADSAIVLKHMFEPRTSGLFEPAQDFTVQMQFRTPYTFQQELNKVTGSATLTNTSGETRDAMSVDAYALADGAGTPVQVRDESGGAGTKRWHRAYDSTLFSIEAVMQEPASVLSSLFLRRRVPVVRGTLTPDGKVAFEYFFGNATSPREFRLVTASNLTVNTVYTITFKKEVTYTAASGTLTPTGVTLSIFIDGVAVADRSYSWTSGGSSYLLHDGVVDVIIGASYVNDALDASIRGSAGGAGYGPTEIPQRFMSPYQDQPGFFTLGFFRLWSAALPDGERIRCYNSSIANAAEQPSLVFNIEVDGTNKPFLTSLTRYAVAFKTGYKAWGTPEPGNLYNFTNHPVGWAMSDRLGYSPKPAEWEDTSNAPCNGLATYSSVVEQSRGLLAVYADSVLSADSGINPTRNLYLSRDGLLNDRTAGMVWRGSPIAERTALTSKGGTPKVYNGKHFTRLGFGEWDGGMPMLACTTGGSLIANKWYSIRVVYASEEAGIQHVSPPVAIKTTASEKLILISMIQRHPDPRVSAIYLAISNAQDSLNLALTGTQFLLSPPLKNEFLDSYSIGTTAGATTTAVDIVPTPAPLCAYSASYNDKLILAGDPLNPDAVYYSYTGVPEKFDTVERVLILEEALGDKINGIMSIFGALFVFKANSTWRLVELSEGQWQKDKLSDVGAVSDRSIVTLSIPDSGATVIAFMSHYGMYLFDGNSFSYIGFPVEEQGEPYKWMDKESVIAVPDPLRRDILFLYKSITDGKVSTFHDKAVGYCFRNNTWYEVTGMLFSASLVAPSSTTIVGDVAQRVDVLLGGRNGNLYVYGGDTLDGLPAEMEGVYTANIGSYTSGELSTDGVFFPRVLEGLWATVVSADGEQWFSIPIVSNTVSTVEVDQDYFEELPFEPQGGDVLYVALVPGFIEFPWDVMDRPFFDKIVHRLTVWTVGDWRFAYATDWIDDLREPWQVNEEADGRRRHIDLQEGQCEALKLKAVTFDRTAKLHTMAYSVTHLEAAVGAQQ